MKINIGDPTEPNLWKQEWFGTKVYVDDKLIPCVFYADEQSGIVKTYWIEGISRSGDNAVEASHDLTNFLACAFPNRTISCITGDVLRETLRGKVRIELP